MSNAWSHLPNAHHIDWVLASLKENPELWDAARDAAWDEAWDTARAEAMSAARDAVWDAARDAARDAAWSAAWYAARGAGWSAARDAPRAAARDAISALVAYDDCDQFLNMPYEKLKVWTVLSEDPRAVLLLPMVYVKEKLNEQCLVTSA
jgi:hypothetical protein